MPLTVIRASAGSGKTYRLAIAYLQLLLHAERAGQPLDPADILATTFTRAAAGEILDRVLQLLSGAVLSVEQCQGLAASTGLPLSQELCGRVLGHLAARLDRLTISTMDAFFGQIAKAFSAELGLAPGWQMAVNEAETEVQRATICSLLGQVDQGALINALATYRKQQVGSAVQGTLERLSDGFQNLPGDPAAPSPFAPAPPRVWEAAEIAAAAQCLGDCEAWVPTNKSGKADARWIKAADDLAALLRPGQKADRLFDSTLAMRVLENGEYYGKGIPEKLAATMAPLIDMARAEIQRLHRARMEAYVWIGNCYRRARLAVLFEQAAYTFGDITHSVKRGAIRSDDLYFRLGTKYRHVLFDEFQDTSREQYAFFQPLLEEIGANGDSSIFVVGDEKQAIYGWRGGDREVMHGPLEELGKQIGMNPAEPLHLSYRSSAAVLNAVNRTVHALERNWIADNPVLEAAGRNWADGFVDHAPAPRVESLRGEVRLLEVEKPEDEDKAAPLVGEVVRRIREHLAEDPARKIAVLLRKKNLMSRLIAEIRQACPEADVSGEGGSPLTDSRAVELVLSLLTWLDHPGHTAARYHLLSSAARTAFGFPESVAADAIAGADEWNALGQIRRALIHQGLAGIIRSWIRHPDFAAHCNAYDRSRCEQLLEVAREWDRQPPGRWSRFVEHVRNRRMERQGGSAVRILTIHASKGLEFETVILLELDGAQRHGGDPEVMEHEGALHLVPAKERAHILGLQDLYEKKVADEFMGELSVLYVGMTRARSFLDIVLRRESKSPVAQLLRTALKPGAGEVVEAFDGISTRDCDAANGRGGFELPDDPGIAKEPAPVPAAAAHAIFHPRTLYTTPSSQEDAGVLSVSSILAPANRGAMQRGECIHAWLSRISWIEDGLPTAPQLLAETRELWAHWSEPQALDEAKGLLAQIGDPATPLHPVFSKATFAPEPGVELWRERHFAVVEAASKSAQLLTGSFDRVVLWRNADGSAARAQIIDFKTDRFSSEADLQRLRERYQPQLAAYSRALCLLLGIAEAQVQCSLKFLFRAEAKKP